MHLVRYQSPGQLPRIGVRRSDAVTPVDGVSTMAELLRLPYAQLRSTAESTRVGASEPVSGVRLLPPLDGRAEVWCAGLTYARSRGARMEESSEQSVYDRVYEAVRPELFPKSPAWRLVTDGEAVGIRSDSGHDVPEPELAVVVNAHCETVGYTICDDVSSRSIEGENPLYIPQAKVFAGSCALAPGIRPAWEVADPTSLGIRLLVQREGATVFAGETSTAKFARTIDDLVEALCRANDFPDGVVLATGTGIVPELEFTLRAGDVIEIEIDQVGRLVNTVDTGKKPFSWLAGEPGHRPELEDAR